LSKYDGEQEQEIKWKLKEVERTRNECGKEVFAEV
jgi:hypothetical protein